MGNYLYLPVIALIFYSFLLCAFIGYNKNPIIKSFLLVLGANVLWTLGSVLMRGQVANLFEVWYHISLLGVLLIPYTLSNFVRCFIDEKASFSLIVIGLSFLPLYCINCATGLFLAPPTLMVDAVGVTSFVYTPTPLVFVLFISPILCCLKIIQFCIQGTRDEIVNATKLVPIICGSVAMIVGHTIIMIPTFSGIPLDILSCNINAVFLFYALYKKRLFKLSVLFSPASCGLLAGAFSLILFWSMNDHLQQLTELVSKGDQATSIIFIILLFCVTAFVLLVLIKYILKCIFVKEEVRQNDLLKEFSIFVSKTLNKDEILEELLHAIQQTLSVHNVYIFLPSTTTAEFNIMKTANPLHQQNFSLCLDNPIIKYLQAHQELLFVKDFRRTTAYKGLWESEKEFFDALALIYIAPLHSNDELVGFVALAKKEGKKENYTLEELSFLSSVTSVASIALQNAILYEHACYEARTDELTGLLNRKYFHIVLEEQFQLCHGQSLTLVILNVDDFKLYNQLYGNAEGDLALKNIGQLVQSMVGEHGFVARYSGKEFAVILPQFDAISANELTASICEKIAGINKNGKEYSMKCLTVSAGICSIPYGATTLKQLLSNVDMAVYQVKQNGKNAIANYCEGVIDHDNAPRALEKEDVYSSYSSTIYALTATIDTKDHYTFQHSNNVAYYASQLALAFGLSQDSVKIIHEAALLHDIGKIGIPEHILNKPGRLTPDEYEAMKTHVENSIGIIRHLPSLDYVIPAVIGHHERYDGKGYPRRIGGEDIPLAARILCIADSFDAMISRRSYKEPMPIVKSLDIVESELGKQFDPVLGNLFVSLVREDKITPHAQVETVAG